MSMNLEAMVVQNSKIPADLLGDPYEALSVTYRNFYFSGLPEHTPGVRTVKAYIHMPRQGRRTSGPGLLGGIVARTDFNQSIDPVRFRVRRALGKKFANSELVLQQVRTRGKSLEFIFAPGNAFVA